jgi:hypothetical protein
LSPFTAISILDISLVMANSPSTIIVENDDKSNAGETNLLSKCLILPEHSSYNNHIYPVVVEYLKSADAQMFIGAHKKIALDVRRHSSPMRKEVQEYFHVISELIEFLLLSSILTCHQILLC